MKPIVQKDIPRVKQLVKEVLAADDYAELVRMGGLTNHSYHVKLEDGSEYVIRIPGEGTEEMIDRSQERISTELACRLGIDEALLCFTLDGAKVTRYIPNAVTMSAERLHDETRVVQIANIFRTLHTCGEDTGVPFDVFEMAASYESIIRGSGVKMFPDYPAVKETVMAIKSEIDAAVCAPKVPCHNDPLCENWVAGNDRLYLIDWEYAGMNDGMWDVADVSIEAGYDDAWDDKLLRAYLGREIGTIDRKHFTASKIYVDFLWTLWAKMRVPYDGQSMEDWAAERYARLKNLIKKYHLLKGE